MSNRDDEDNERGERADADYRVGDNHPPRHTQFPPGVSGNPKGRPKGSTNLRTRVHQGLRKTVTVNKGGRPVRMAVVDVISNRVLESSMKGDFKAIQFVPQSEQEAPEVQTASRGEAEDVRHPDKGSLRLIARWQRRLTEEAE